MVVLINRSYLHLCELQRVVVIMPNFPDDSVTETLMWTAEVQTVEIGKMTSIVPPSAFVLFCATFPGFSVVVHVKGRETKATVIFQRISYKFMKIMQ